jgi:predicted secreted protein
MLRACLAFAALPLLIASGGCTHDAPPPVDAAGGVPSSSADTVVRLDDDGKTIEVAQGTRVVFKLAASSGTGYAWVAAPVDASVLAAQGERAVERSADAPGAPKLDVLRFLAKGPGMVVVQLDLKRPWGDEPAVKTIKVTINVH